MSSRSDGIEKLPLAEVIFDPAHPAIVLHDPNTHRVRIGLDSIPPFPKDGPMARIFLDKSLSNEAKRQHLLRLLDEPGDDETEFRVVADLLREMTLG